MKKINFNQKVLSIIEAMDDIQQPTAELIKAEMHKCIIEIINLSQSLTIGLQVMDGPELEQSKQQMDTLSKWVLDLDAVKYPDIDEYDNETEYQSALDRMWTVIQRINWNIKEQL